MEQVASDPFERLEQLFAPKESTFVVQEEKPEPAKPKMDPNAEARRISEMERERERRQKEELEEQRTRAFQKRDHGDLTAGEDDKAKEEISLITLFDDPDDIRKAIIYTEIFNTKYF